MVIVGGSAFILLGKLTRATHDIDALSVPKELYSLLGKYDINTDVERGKAVRTEQDVSVSAGDTQRSSDMIGCQGDGKLLIAVFFPDGLVDVIPDKATLIAAVLLIGKVRVLVQSTVGVAHSMRIFALDIRPLIALCQILFNVLDRAVHMALDIGGFKEAGDR